MVIHGKDLDAELNGQDIILWQCHRAKAQAEQINASHSPVLKRLGGTISPEHEIPKLMWLKQHQPKVFAKARYFFDLADWLIFKLTGSNSRSICTTTCKWTFNGNGHGWDDEFFRSIDLAELVDAGYQRIGSSEQIMPVGTNLGTLSTEAAEALQLKPQTIVATGMIDAHAGALGLLGIHITNVDLDIKVNNKLALIAGTSSCHMALSQKELFVPGIWGPFPDAVLPGMSLTEGVNLP